MAFESVVANIVDNANKNMLIHEKDYVKDGLLYCYKCNTPKQKEQYFGFMNKTQIVNMLCECEQKKRDETEHKERVRKLRERCIPEEHLHHYTFANDDRKNPELSQKARWYVDNFDEHYKQGKGLLLFGGVGYGKTYIAVCIANALIDKGKSCVLSDFPKIAREWESIYGHKEAYLEKLNACDVLIIDDFGVERKSEMVQEMVFSVINYRLNAKRPIIITTNLQAKDFQNPMDTQQDRIFSRLFEACIPHECNGEDRRKAEFVKASKEANKQISIWGKQ